MVMWTEFASVFAVFLLSFVSAAAPGVAARFLPSSDFTKTKGFQFFAGCGSGALLSIGLVHSFAEGVEALGYAVDEGGLPEFAWGGVFALVGTLVTLAMEIVVNAVVHEIVKSKDKAAALEDCTKDEDSTPAAGEEGDTPAGEGEESTAEGEEREEDSKEDSKVPQCFGEDLHTFAELYALLVGISFHSVFVGFTLGLSRGDMGLFIAVLVHQLFEGVALGSKVLISGIKSSVHVVLLELMFAVATPIGIVIGLSITTTIEERPVTYAIVHGTFQSFSAGILVYVAILHFIDEELKRPGCAPGVFYSGILLGAAILAIAALWV